MARNIHIHDPYVADDVLIRQLAREGLAHRKQRLYARKVRLQQSQMEIEELEKTVSKVESLVGTPERGTY